jgi:hypothetical protein
MPLVNSSPWADAANYGQGFGQALGNILMNQPQMRLQAAQKAAELQQSNALNQAQIGELGARQRLYQQQAAPVGQVQGLPQGVGNLDPQQAAMIGNVLARIMGANTQAAKGQVIPRGGTLVQPGGNTIQGQPYSYQPRVQGPTMGQEAQGIDAITKAQTLGMDTNPAVQALIQALTNGLPQGQSQAFSSPGAPAQPGQMPQRPMRGQQPVQVNDQATYDALPPGSIYIDSSGQTKRKGQ